MGRKEIKAAGKEIAKKQWGELLLVELVSAAVLALLTVFTIGIGAVIFEGVVLVGGNYVYYIATRGEQISASSLWTKLKENFKTIKFGQIVLGVILKSVIVAIPICAAYVVILIFGLIGGLIGAITGGFAGLVIVVGIITAAAVIAGTIVTIGVMLALGMTEYLMVRENGIKGIAALKKSNEMMKGHKKELLVFCISFIGWFLLCVLTFGLLLIWVAPYFRSAKTVLFNEIYDNSPVASKSMDDSVDFKEMAASVKSEFAGAAGSFTNNSAKFCKNCGAPLAQGQAFCGKCGHPRD